MSIVCVNICIYIYVCVLVYFLFIHSDSVYLSIITCLFSSISTRYFCKGIKLLKNVQIQHDRSVCVCIRIDCFSVCYSHQYEKYTCPNCRY